jgi:hypothetical protein
MARSSRGRLPGSCPTAILGAEEAVSVFGGPAVILTFTSFYVVVAATTICVVAR